MSYRGLFLIENKLSGTRKGQSEWTLSGTACRTEENEQFFSCERARDVRSKGNACPWAFERQKEVNKISPRYIISRRRREVQEGFEKPHSCTFIKGEIKLNAQKGKNLF